MATVGLKLAALLFVVSFGSSRQQNSSWREGCIWWRQPNNGLNSPTSEFMLNCNVRSLTSDFWSSHSFNGQQHAATHALKVKCHEKLFFQSYLPENNDTLAQLPSLKEVEIDSCKIRKMNAGIWSSLNALETLQIRTKNAEWGSKVTLELERDAFAGQSGLKKLDLSENNMWDLGDKNILCPLHGIKSLNFSANSLVEFVQLQGNSGDVSYCALSDLKVVDLTLNKIRHVGDHGFSRAPKLTHLRLQKNQIDELKDSAFTGLTELKMLNLSSNRLVALPPNVFTPLTKLIELYLSDNLIGSLSPSVFSQLTSLKMLDLSKNRVTGEWLVESHIFSNCVQLVFLKLSSNEIHSLNNPSVFTGLANLQMLDLSNNQLSSVHPQLFSSLVNLEQLDLSRNSLTAVPAPLFGTLAHLQQLYMDHNKLNTLESSVFNNCSNVRDLGMAANQFVTIPAAIRSLKKLVTLDMGENTIRSLGNNGNDTFKGLSQLYGLRLVDNKLEDLPAGFCQHLRQLRVLNLAANKIRRVQESTFSGCDQVRALRLDGNSLEELPPSFGAELPSVLWLNVSRNALTAFQYHVIPKTIEWLDLSHNELTKLHLSDQGRVGGSWNLRVVDASHNELDSLDSSSFPYSVERVRVNYNKISHIPANTFSRFPGLRTVELIGNELSNFDLSSLRVLKALGKPNAEFHLRNNPFICDCSLEWLKNVNSNPNHYGHVVDLHAVMCSETNGSVVPLLEKKEWLCEYNSHCPVDCYCCEFDACDCEMSCPKGCTCSHNSEWTTNIVQCGNVSFELPQRIPMDATEIHLDGNHIPVLSSHGFIGKRNLQTLYLNGSHVSEVQNKSFNGLKNLRSLYLDNNELRSLEGYEFSDVPNLLQLYLQNNKISFIAVDTFTPLQYLQVLRLDGNELLNYPLWQFSTTNPHLSSIHLYKNPWSCQCDYIISVRKWIHSVSIVENSHSLQCAQDKDGSAQLVSINAISCDYAAAPHYLPKNEQLPFEEESNKKRSNKDQENVVSDQFYPHNKNIMRVEDNLSPPHYQHDEDMASVAPSSFQELWTLVTILVTLLILLLALGLVFRKEIYHRTLDMMKDAKKIICCSTDRRNKVWQKSSPTPSLSAEKLFDAYFLYSKPDGEFLVDKISQQLPNYRLCFHHRDFSLPSAVHSDAEIAWTNVDTELMHSACESTRSVVILLSTSFLQTLLLPQNTDSPSSVLIDMINQCTRNKQKIIFILFPPFNSFNVCQLLPIGENTVCLEWQDPLFWTKLKMCLPSVGNGVGTIKNSVRLNNSTMMENNKSATDSLLLAYDSNSSSVGSNQSSVGSAVYNYAPGSMMGVPAVAFHESFRRHLQAQTLERQSLTNNARRSSSVNVSRPLPFLGLQGGFQDPPNVHSYNNNNNNSFVDHRSHNGLVDPTEHVYSTLDSSASSCSDMLTNNTRAPNISTNSNGLMYFV